MNSAFEPTREIFLPKSLPNTLHLSQRWCGWTRLHVSFPSTCNNFASLLTSTSDAVGRKILEELLSRPIGSSTPQNLVRELGLDKVDASDELEGWCHQCVQQLGSEAAAFRGGNERVIGKMVGYVRRLSGGRADPTATETILRRLL